MKRIFLLAIFALSLLLVGCAGPSSSSYLDKPLAPTAASKEIDVVELKDVPNKYTIIGEVSGFGIKSLKDQARKLGADAISLPKLDRSTYLQTSQAIKYK